MPVTADSLFRAVRVLVQELKTPLDVSALWPDDRANYQLNIEMHMVRPLMEALKEIVPEEKHLYLLTFEVMHALQDASDAEVQMIRAPRTETDGRQRT